MRQNYWKRSTGKGIALGEHDKDLFEGTERMFKPGYMANLVSSWIPALDNGNVEQALKIGLLTSTYFCRLCLEVQHLLNYDKVQENRGLR